MATMLAAKEQENTRSLTQFSFFGGPDAIIILHSTTTTTHAQDHMCVLCTHARYRASTKTVAVKFMLGRVALEPLRLKSFAAPCNFRK